MLDVYLFNSFAGEDVFVLEREVSYYSNSMSITEEKVPKDVEPMERYTFAKISFMLVNSTDDVIFHVN